MRIYILIKIHKAISQKYIDGDFEVKIENGLIQIKISPKEEKSKVKKIF